MDLASVTRGDRIIAEEYEVANSPSTLFVLPEPNGERIPNNLERGV